MKALFKVSKETWASLPNETYELFLTSSTLQSDKTFSKITNFSPVSIWSNRDIYNYAKKIPPAKLVRSVLQDFHDL